MKLSVLLLCFVVAAVSSLPLLRSGITENGDLQNQIDQIGRAYEDAVKNREDTSLDSSELLRDTVLTQPESSFVGEHSRQAKGIEPSKAVVVPDAKTHVVRQNKPSDPPTSAPAPDAAPDPAPAPAPAPSSNGSSAFDCPKEDTKQEDALRALKAKLFQLESQQGIESKEVEKAVAITQTAERQLEDITSKIYALKQSIKWAQVTAKLATQKNGALLTDLALHDKLMHEAKKKISDLQIKLTQVELGMCRKREADSVREARAMSHNDEEYKATVALIAKERSHVKMESDQTARLEQMSAAAQKNVQNAVANIRALKIELQNTQQDAIVAARRVLEANTLRKKHDDALCALKSQVAALDKDRTNMEAQINQRVKRDEAKEMDDEDEEYADADAEDDAEDDADAELEAEVNAKDDSQCDAEDDVEEDPEEDSEVNAEADAELSSEVNVEEDAQFDAEEDGDEEAEEDADEDAEEKAQDDSEVDTENKEDADDEAGVDADDSEADEDADKLRKEYDEARRKRDEADAHVSAEEAAVSIAERIADMTRDRLAESAHKLRLLKRMSKDVQAVSTELKAELQAAQTRNELHAQCKRAARAEEERLELLMAEPRELGDEDEAGLMKRITEKEEQVRKQAIQAAHDEQELQQERSRLDDVHAAMSAHASALHSERSDASRAAQNARLAQELLAYHDKKLSAARRAQSDAQEHQTLVEDKLRRATH